MRAVVADRFEIEYLAGAGAAGAVYRARDRSSGAAVALKVLRASSAGDSARFAREARIVSALRHPGIVRYIGHGETADGEKYLAMEWLDGQSLSRRLAGAGLTPVDTVALGIRVGEALGAAHAKGIVHRDLKPSNLLLVAGAIDEVRIIDFGIARLDYDDRLTATGMVLGTPGYMPPEQARGDRHIDARADVYSLGCVLFQCLTGQKPFVGDDALAVLLKVVIEDAPRLSDLRDGIPDELDELIARMLAKEPERRPRDGSAVAQELRQLVSAIEMSGPASVRKASLTPMERRPMCLVIARPASRPDDAILDAMQTIARRYGGATHALADGTIVVMHATASAMTDEAFSAARCALALRALLPDASMAVVTGREILSSLPLGAVIDRAVRLLDASRPSIHVDEVTAGLLDTRFDLGSDALGLELRGERDVADATRTLLGKATPCVGRERELKQIEALYDECASERVARALLVTGPPGVGKSRLRYEFVLRSSTRRDAGQVWIGRAEPMGSGLSLGILADALRRLVGLMPSDPPELQQRKLRARVGRHVDELDVARVSGFLGELLGVHYPDDDSLELQAARRDPVVMSDQVGRALDDFLAAECARTLTIVVLEDLHWGDDATVAFLEDALRKLRNRPLLVMAFARPEVHERFPRLFADLDAIEIRLGGLSAKASGELVRAALGPDTPQDVIQTIVDRADGNAFYLEELIRTIALGADMVLPETVVAMAQARLAALDPDRRRVLRAASVFGRIFWRGGVGALLGDTMPRAHVDAHLDELVRNEIITPRVEQRFPGEREYAFRHALVREAALAMLTDEDRTLGHRLAAEWLEEVGEPDPAVLAGFFELSGDRPRAIACYRRAAERALERNDPHGALARAACAVRCGATGASLGAVRLVEATAHAWLGETAAAARQALEALTLLPRGGALWCASAEEAIVAHSRLLDDAVVLQLAEDLHAAAGLEGNRAWASAAPRAAAGIVRLGRVDLATRLLDRAEAFARSEAAERDPLRGARERLIRATQALLAGDLGADVAHRSGAADILERAGDLRAACDQRIAIASTYLATGANDAAERVLREQLERAERLSLVYHRALGRYELGLALARRGARGKARTFEEHALAGFARSGCSRMEALARVRLSWILVTQGELDRAEREARACEPALKDAPKLRAWALATLGHVLLAAKRPTEALAAASEAMGLLGLGDADEAEVRSATVLEGRASVRLIYGEALEAVGNRAEAQVAIRRAARELKDRANAIADATLRQRFLVNVPEHARTFAVFRRLGA